MPSILLSFAEFDHLLDGLALTASLMLIIFLAFNRFKYGRLVLGRRFDRSKNRFAGERSLPAMSQRSRQAYANLQRSLKREFEQLQKLSEPLAPHSGPLAVADQDERRWRYREAQEMLRRSVDVAAIQQRLGLMDGELELLRGLGQLAEGIKSAEHDKAMAHSPSTS